MEHAIWLNLRDETCNLAQLCGTIFALWLNLKDVFCTLLFRGCLGTMMFAGLGQGESGLVGFRPDGCDGLDELGTGGGLETGVTVGLSGRVALPGIGRAGLRKTRLSARGDEVGLELGSGWWSPGVGYGGRDLRGRGSAGQVDGLAGGFRHDCLWFEYLVLFACGGGSGL
ncbi:hypothetical protein Tco_1051857 [Tanacetum coccineum]